MKAPTIYNMAFFVIAGILLVGCSSATLVHQYKDAEVMSFKANKVLVIGISVNEDLRRIYEQKMIEALQEEHVLAVESIDFLEESFTDNKKSYLQLNEIEIKLLESGFDAILLTTITGRDTRVSLINAYRNFEVNYQTFENYYYDNQNIYFQEPLEQEYEVITTQTSLFCICPEKEREILWHCTIEIVKEDKLKRNINDYIAVLFKKLKENNLLLLQE